MAVCFVTVYDYIVVVSHFIIHIVHDIFASVYERSK